MKAPASQQQAIRNQQVHTGPAGLNIPELPEDASDDEIRAALVNLDEAGTTLLAKRRALAEDTEKFFLSGSPEMTEAQAAIKSSQIKGILKESKIRITDLTGIGDL